MRGCTLSLAQACIFHFVAYQEDGARGTWVDMEGMLESINYSKYIAALYWSMSTMTTVGYVSSVHLPHFPALITTR